MIAAATAVTALHRRIAVMLFLRLLLGHVAVACILWGAAILLTKRFAQPLPPWVGMLILGAAVSIAFVRARRITPRRDAVVALLDAHAQCGGLLMAQETVGAGEWEPRVDAIPRVVWRGRRTAIVAALCALFVVAAMIVPARAKTTQHKLAVDADVDRLQTRVDLLEEEDIVPAEQAETITDTLEQLRGEAAGEDPAKAWETLDSIDEATARAAREAGDAAVEQAEQLTRAETMSFALGEAGLDPSQIAAGMDDLAAEMREHDDLLATLPPELQKAIAEKSLTSEELRRLGQAARNQKAALRATLARLRDAGLIDPKTLRAFEDGADVGNRDDLARFLRENATRTRLADSVGTWCRGGPGVDRGRADAPMFFGDESRDGQFREQTLPAASAATLARSELVAVSAGAPSQQNAQQSVGGALTNAQAGGGSALTPVVQPRHRGTVRRFFERKQR